MGTEFHVGLLYLYFASGLCFAIDIAHLRRIYLFLTSSTQPNDSSKYIFVLWQCGCHLLTCLPSVPFRYRSLGGAAVWISALFQTHSTIPRQRLSRILTWCSTHNSISRVSHNQQGLVLGSIYNSKCFFDQIKSNLY